MDSDGIERFSCPTNFGDRYGHLLQSARNIRVLLDFHCVELTPAAKGRSVASATLRALDGKEMFDHKKSAGMIYHAALRNEMQARLGVEFGEVSKDGQADIRGVPRELLSLWSKRSRAIAPPNASRSIKIDSPRCVMT